MPILDDHCLEFISRSPEQTRRIGMRLGGLLQAGDLICLQGELGSGKTTLAQGIAQGWGSLDAASSPTFILVNVYRRPDGAELFHIDAYRIESAPEGKELDLEAMLSQGPLLIEWPERLGNILPPARLSVNLEHVTEEHRQMRMLASGARYDALVAELRQAIFGVG